MRLRVLAFLVILSFIELMAIFVVRMRFVSKPAVSTSKGLDFSGNYDVKLDVDYLRRNLMPAHE